MKITIFIFAIISFTACISKINERKVNSDTNHVVQLRDQSNSEKAKTDTIADLKKTGLAILDGLEISKINEKYVYQLIDSIMTKDSIERKFYFKVFNKIREEAEGNIAEETDFSAKNFCRKYPNDFFCMTNSELKSYAYDIGELIRTEEEDPVGFAKEFINDITQRINPKYLLKVETFAKDMSEEMESRK